MPLTLNTYGLRSINAETFNTYRHRESYIPENTRSMAVTALRINNLTLNILGYIPGVRQISGIVRMGIGSGIILFTLALGSPTASEGLIIGHWYKEAVATGVAQIARGAFEAFVPFGWIVNASLDTIGTLVNVITDAARAPYLGGLSDEEIEEVKAEYANRTAPPWGDVKYPFPFRILEIV